MGRKDIEGKGIEGKGIYGKGMDGKGIDGKGEVTVVIALLSGYANGEGKGCLSDLIGVCHTRWLQPVSSVVGCMRERRDEGGPTKARRPTFRDRGQAAVCTKRLCRVISYGAEGPLRAHWTTAAMAHTSQCSSHRCRDYTADPSSQSSQTEATPIPMQSRTADGTAKIIVAWH